MEGGAFVVVGCIDIDAGLDVAADEVRIALRRRCAQLGRAADLVKSQPAHSMRMLCVRSGGMFHFLLVISLLTVSRCRVEVVKAVPLHHPVPLAAQPPTPPKDNFKSAS